MFCGKFDYLFYTKKFSTYLNATYNYTVLSSACTIFLNDSQYYNCHVQKTLLGVEHYCIASPHALPPSLQTPEVNSLGYDASRGLVYAACGDWRTHVYDLETGKRTQTLEGHDDYVHDVVARWVCLLFFRSG